MPNHYTVTETSYNSVSYRYIKTPIELIRPLIINQPLCATSNIGINGGHYAPAEKDVYNVPPKAGVSINWYKESDGTIDTNSHLTNDADQDNTIYRGTLCVFRTASGIARAFVVRTTDVDSVIRENTACDFFAMIGGGSLALLNTDDVWETIQANEQFDALAYNLPLARRSAIGYKYDATDGIVYAYLIVSLEWTNLAGIRNFCKNSLQLDDAIHLDGSGSTQMQWYDTAGNLQKDKGSDKNNSTMPNGRYIWNMVKITNPA